MAVFARPTVRSLLTSARMSMRIQELHPSVVHFPLAFYPASLIADAVGLRRRDPRLLAAGRWAMGLAVGSAALAGVLGLVAQEAVSTDARSEPLLVTHRSLNVGFLALATGLLVHRTRVRRPGPGYFAVGFAGLGVALFSAYLGGKMVYEHGVGVAAAGTLPLDRAPEITARNGIRASRVAVRELGQALVNTARDIARGRLVPALRSSLTTP